MKTMSKTDSEWERTVVELSAIGKDSEEDLWKRIDKAHRAITKADGSMPVFSELLAQLYLYKGDAYCRLAKKEEDGTLEQKNKSEYYRLARDSVMAAITEAEKQGDSSLKKLASSYAQRLSFLLYSLADSEKERWEHLKSSNPPARVRRFIDIYEWDEKGYKLPEGENDTKALM